jgi:polar amino acid transport system substrate-binding protein
LKPSILITSFLIVFVAHGCANLPRDPKKTLRQLQSRPIRVGLVENPPWVVRSSGEPSGVEVDLIRNFASELGTTAEWHWGGEQKQLEALEYYQLDIVLGGLTDQTPWRKYVALTSPYFEDSEKLKHVIAVPPGENALVKRLDEFLYKKRFEIPNLLQQQASNK